MISRRYHMIFHRVILIGAVLKEVKGGFWIGRGSEMEGQEDDYDSFHDIIMML